MNESTVDRKAARIQVSAEEARKTAAARVQQEHRKSELAIERERQKLALQRERRIARQQARREKRSARRHARTQLVARLNSLAPTIGRRAMITGPILAPMIVAWIGQISFAMETLGWIFIGALAFAAAWELTTAFAAWMYHQARKDGDRGTLFRVATWIFAASAGAMNYWHALDGGSIYHPTPKAVSYGTMSLVGIALWELYSSLVHRKHLRAAGKVAEARPRFGILRWVRFPRITWHAWSLAVRYGIKTVDEAWAAAVTEIERVDRAKAVAAERKQLAKDQRPAVRVTVVRTVTYTHGGPGSTATLPLYRIVRPVGYWDLDPLPETGPRKELETGPANRSGTGPNDGSKTGLGGGSETWSPSRSETGPGGGSEGQVPSNSGPGSETHGRDQTRTGPKRRSRRRSKTGPKVKVSDRLDEAIAADKAYMADHGRHIPAEKLAKALSIGKPAALDLVKQVRGGHIDVAK